MLRFRQITLNLLYFCNVLLIFLLIFEEKVQLPVMLQVTGRLHPLVLHFPLALLFVGIFLEWLTSRKSFNHPASRDLTSCIFYLFALGASFTALFGFFLYQEGSYLGPEVDWHKWTGTAVSLFAVMIVLLREKSSVLYYATLGLTAVCLTLTGHLGAEITHGKGFVTEPMRRHWSERIEIVHVDSAVVFRDVIQPILNEKCINCHNSNKAKNDLILADYNSILDGGENADAVVAGKADESLLYKYVQLPMDDSLHMPPKGKLQLDPEEIELIGWWINAGAMPDVKYVNYSKPDSIHPIMLSKFRPKTGLDLVDIAFADPETVKKLNNPYRTVQQISASKPYVAVFLGSKKDFSSVDLNELKGIRKQIVSIDLGNSEVNEDDLELLTQFPHLQKLHLQNIDIGDEDVRQLRGLRYLETLNLSGTRISARALEEISGWENLKKLYVYNTPIADENVKTLKTAHTKLQVFNTQFDLSDSVYNAQLTIPVCKIDSTFFRENATVEVKLSRGRVKYYYTLDGSEPSSKANLYAQPFQVKQSCELKFIATMEGWIESKVATFPLLRVGIKPDRVTLETTPDPKHSGKLDTTLVDGKSGGLNRGAKEYLGFVKQNPQALFQFNIPVKLSQLTISFLEDVGNGVFAPEHVEIWGGVDKNKLTKLGELKTSIPREERSSAKSILKIDFPEQPVKFIRIKVKKFSALPRWLTNKKTVGPSIFIDEVALN
ncbi:MAG: FN3 associated domain-containing protein [Cyclobacteriaceae bacterium]